MAPPPSTLNGFTVLPVSYSSSSTHYIYARQHTAPKTPEASSSKSRKVDLPAGRTLFLVNVPPDATERELVVLFKPCGTVEKVILDFEGNDIQNDGADSDSEEEEDEEDGVDADAMQEDEVEQEGSRRRKRRRVAKEEVPKVVPIPQNPHRTIRKTGLTAYIIFLDASSMDKIPSLASKKRQWPSSTDEEPSGLAHYAAMYRNLRPPLDSIQEHVDTYMELFEYQLAKSKQKSQYKKGEAIVDEDGFTLVTRGGAYGKTLGGGVAVASKRFQRSGETARVRSKKEKPEKEGFYAFQKAEKQRSELINLKRKWEEDKAKVEKLKQSRKFKPY